MGHAKRLAHQAFHAAEALCERKQLQLAYDPLGVAIVAFDHHGNHPAGKRHLPARQLMMRMRGQPREPDPFDLRLLLQPLGKQQRIAAVALHTQRQGTNTAQRQETAERIEHAANRVL